MSELSEYKLKVAKLLDKVQDDIGDEAFDYLFEKLDL